MWSRHVFTTPDRKEVKTLLLKKELGQTLYTFNAITWNVGRGCRNLILCYLCKLGTWTSNSNLKHSFLNLILRYFANIALNVVLFITNN